MPHFDVARDIVKGLVYDDVLFPYRILLFMFSVSSSFKLCEPIDLAFYTEFPNLKCMMSSAKILMLPKTKIRDENEKSAWKKYFVQ